MTHYQTYYYSYDFWQKNNMKYKLHELIVDLAPYIGLESTVIPTLTPFTNSASPLCSEKMDQRSTVWASLRFSQYYRCHYLAMEFCVTIFRLYCAKITFFPVPVVLRLKQNKKERFAQIQQLQRSMSCYFDVLECNNVVGAELVRDLRICALN